MAQAHLLLAESHHLGGNSPVALRKVADVLHQAPDNISAHMLLTRIYLHQVSVLDTACGLCIKESVTGFFGHHVLVDMHTTWRIARMQHACGQ